MILLFDEISFDEEIRSLSLNILHLWRMKLRVDIRRSKILENDNLSKLSTNPKNSRE